MSGLIDGGTLNKMITEIEKCMSALDITEKYLVLEQVKHRLHLQVEEVRKADNLSYAMNKIPFGKLINKAIKASEEGDEHEKL